MSELELDAVRRGGKAALARALARVERAPQAAEVVQLLDAAWAEPRGRVIGITGPPGVGKSTLVGALIRRLRARGLTVAVIAVDPSSRRSGGALLGDRVRLLADAADPGLFVRSMAARDRLGGLAALSWSAAILMRALYDRVIVETVGVGQSETDVAGLADSVVFCVQPGSGDTLQFMKAGIVEIPHLAAITKADSGAAARRALEDVRAALGMVERQEDWAVRSLTCSAETGEGLDQLEEGLECHWAWLMQGNRLAEQRKRQAEDWLRACLLDDYGRRGLERVDLPLRVEKQGPFSRLVEVNRAINK